MRKLVCVLLSVLLLTALVLPISAEEGSMFTVTASPSRVKAGQTVTLTITAAESAPECCAFAVQLQYDTDVFELDSFDVEPNPGGFSQGVSETSPFISLGGLNAQSDGSAPSTKPTGKVGTVVLKAREDAALGEKTVTCSARLIQADDEAGISGTVNNVTVNIVDVTLGDANGDGRVNSKDATRILRYSGNRITADEIDLAACDVNGDGRVNSKDATQVLRYAGGRITKFPVEQ